MALHFMGAGIPMPSQELAIGGGGGSAVKGLRSDKGLSPSFQLQTKDHLLPPPSPSRAPCCCPSEGGCPRAPQAPTHSEACQSCPKHITGSRLQRMSWNQAQPPFSAKTLPFSARARQARQWGHHYPNNEASGMQEAHQWGGRGRGGRLPGLHKCTQSSFQLPSPRPCQEQGTMRTRAEADSGHWGTGAGGRQREGDEGRRHRESLREDV